MSSLYPRAGNYASLKMLLTPRPAPYYSPNMLTDHLNLAAFVAFCFMLAGVVRFAAKSYIKESTMHGDLSRTPAPQAVHIHNARETLRLNPRPVGVTFESDDPLDFDFVAMDAKATRAANVLRIIFAPRIQWCLLTDVEIEHIAATCPPSMKDRALNARSKRARRRANEARRAAKGGVK